MSVPPPSCTDSGKFLREVHNVGVEDDKFVVTAGIDIMTAAKIDGYTLSRWSRTDPRTGLTHAQDYFIEIHPPRRAARADQRLRHGGAVLDPPTRKFLAMVRGQSTSL